MTTEQPLIISSSANPFIKRVRSLRNRRFRQSEGVVVLEGLRLVEDVLATGVRPEIVLFREDLDLSERERFSSFACRTVASNLFDDLASTVTPQPLLAIVPQPRLPLELSTTPLLLIADTIRDPGNLGTLIRSAAAAGADAVLTTPGTADPWSDKCLRAGMGAHWQIPVLPIGEALPTLPADLVFVGTSSEALVSYSEFDWRPSVAVVVGGEAEGLSAESSMRISSTVSIPMNRGIESLNAAVAGSVILFEVDRQRNLEKSSNLS